MRRTCVASLAVCLTLAAFVPLALAQGTYTQIDYPGAVSTGVNGINVAGESVGWYYDGVTTHGFLLSGNVFTTIDGPGASITQLNGINDAGEIAGYDDANGFVYDMQTQKFRTIAYPGASATLAIGINNSGAITGFYSLGNQHFGFELQGKTYRTLAPQGAKQDVYPMGINDIGRVVGYVISAQQQLAGFKFSNNVFKKFSIPGGKSTWVRGLNNRGAIVGYYDTGAGTIVGFVFQNHTVSTLQFPGALVTYANAINDSGTAGGEFVDSTGQVHGFIWTPSADAASK